MRIKLVELTNFKSFKDKTTIHYHKNINVIVGKNGSGKSNLISAIQLITCCPKLGPEERSNFIHEGSLSHCEIEIVFDNSNQRYHGNKEISIKRILSSTKDEFYMDGRSTPLEEVRGVFESAGIPVVSPYFLVLQGKINSLAVMTDEQRLNLIKNVAGISKYEEDREKSLAMLEETKHTQSKVEGILSRVVDKLGGLERDKEQLDECEALENEKRRCEVAYMQREILEINRSIKEIETKCIDQEEEESEEVEDLEMKIREVRKEIEEVVKKSSETANEREKIKTIEQKLVENSSQLQNLLFKKSKIEEVEEDCFTEIEVIKVLSKSGGNSVAGQVVENKVMDNQVMDNRDMCTILTEGTNAPHTNIPHTNTTHTNTTHTNIPHTIPSTPLTTLPYSTTLPHSTPLKDLVEKRNQLWREEKKFKEDLKEVEEGLKGIGSRIILSGGCLIEEIKKLEGVLGYVLDIFDVPEDLIPPFTAIANNYLFNIVVLDEGVVSRVPQGGLTFMPLNKMFYEDQKDNLEGENLILLSSKIKINSSFEGIPKIQDLLLYITKGFFITSDLKTASFYSKKFNINICTLEGDVFDKSGVIVGGYEKKKSVLLEYKRLSKNKESIKKKLGDVKDTLCKINYQIDLINNLSSNGGMKINYKKFNSYLEDLKKNSLEKLKSKSKDLQLKLDLVEGEKETISRGIQKVKEKMDSLKRGYLEIKGDCLWEDKLSILKGKEKELVSKLKERDLVIVDRVEDIEEEKVRARKVVLYGKRLELMKKMGLQTHKNFEIIYPELDKEGLTNKLREYQQSLKKYLIINKRAVGQWNTFILQKDSLKERLVDLKNNLIKIKEFIGELDGKKERFLEFTLEMFRNNFKYFSKRLCTFGELDLLKEGDCLSVVQEGGTIDLNILSGGQKTMVALCLIFSIQKIDPSPFYVFDEVDANLDKQGREKIVELFKEIALEEDVQIIISTFKEELVESGNKFVGVSFKEKKSYAGEVSKEIVKEFLSE